MKGQRMGGGAQEDRRLCCAPAHPSRPATPPAFATETAKKGEGHDKKATRFFRGFSVLGVGCQKPFARLEASRLPIGETYVGSPA